MKRIGNVWEEVTSMENLHRACRRAAKGRRGRESVKRVEANLDYYLPLLQKMLREGTYRTSQYITRIIREPKERKIYILPFFPDRIAHHAVMDVLRPYLQARMDIATHSAIEGRGQITGSRKCMEYVRKYKYVLKCDISKFYPSMDHAVLKECLVRKIKDKNALNVLFEIIDSVNKVPGETPGKNAPIGSVTSQDLHNLLMWLLDSYVRENLHCNAYIRYCDDFVLFAQDKGTLHTWAKSIEDFLRDRLKLKLSKCFIFPVSQGVDFLGYRHFPKYILVRKTTATRIKHRVRHIATCLHKYAKINIERYRGQIDSAHGWLSHANTKNLRRTLNFEQVRQEVHDYGKF